MAIRSMQELPPEWVNLMRVADAIKYGRAEILFENGKPVRVNCAVKQIMLNNPQEFEDSFKSIPIV